MANGLTLEQAKNLRGILSRRVNAFRRALRGNSPTKAEFIEVQLEPGAQAIKARPSGYVP